MEKRNFRSFSKIWQNRFAKQLHPLIEQFTESISFDYRLALYDIDGSIAHVKMLCKIGIISKKIQDRLIKGLENIRKRIIKGDFKFTREYEDVHMNIEKALEEEVGEFASYLHTGRSRNDQVQLDMRLFTRDAIGTIIDSITMLQRSLVNLAENSIDVIIPGYTHLQHAQPILLAHHFLAYTEMLERDKARLQDLLPRVNILPLGSSALAGSSIPLDREYVANLLGFSTVSANSIDSVSDRDYLIELSSCISIIAVHLSRFSEEIILWSNPEFGFITLDDSVCTGSSFMPQKKNPDPAELVRGKTGRVIGNLLNLLITLKALPFSYNRDLQEDKPPIFDSVKTIFECLNVCALLVTSIQVNHDRIKEVLGKDEFIYATDITEYLVKKGVPFRIAYKSVGNMVKYCILHKKSFSGLSMEELKRFNKAFEEDFYFLLSPEISVKNKTTYGSTNPSIVKKQIIRWKGRLK